MVIVYIFESASCITSYTHRDFVSAPGFPEGGWGGQMSRFSPPCSPRWYQTHGL